jgi:hypothetical protein
MLKIWLITHSTPGDGKVRSEGMRQPSKLEIDTEKCRGSANGRGAVFSDFRVEAVSGRWRGLAGRE